MMARGCPQESTVQRAAASGRWTQELRAHASSCEACRDVMTVTSLLSGDAPVVPRRISPGILFARARHERRRRAETLASRILLGGQLLEDVGDIDFLVERNAATAGVGPHHFAADDHRIRKRDFQLLSDGDGHVGRQHHAPVGHVADAPQTGVTVAHNLGDPPDGAITVTAATIATRGPASSLRMLTLSVCHSA